MIREAVRALAAKGMLEVRSGMASGSWRWTTVRESMRHFVQGSSLDYGKVDEMRGVLEVAAAGFAAQRATPEDIAAIDENIDAFENECSNLDRSVGLDWRSTGRSPRPRTTSCSWCCTTAWARC